MNPVKTIRINFPPYEVSCYLEYNEHKSDSRLEYYFRCFDIKVEDFRSEDDYNKSVETDELWSLQWYPNTPVGFCKIYGSTSDKISERISEYTECSGYKTRDLVIPENTIMFELAHNDHKAVYGTVSQELRHLETRYPQKVNSFISEEERQKAINTNEWWFFKWNEEIGGENQYASASTFEALNEHLKSITHRE